MHGPLSEIGLIEVLQLLERGRRSGRLRVMGPGNDPPHTLWIREGVVVAVEPGASDAAVQKMLILRAEVASDEATGVEQLPHSYREALREELARRVIGTMLHWEQGRFDFEALPVTDGPLSWSTDALVLDLVERESRRAELQELLGEWQAVVDRALPADVRNGSIISLESLDWRILDAIDGTRDVAALAAHLREPLEDVGTRVRVLEAAAILQLRQPEPTRQDTDVLSGRLAETAPSIDLLRSHLRQAPSDGLAWRALGLTEVGAGRFDRAIVAWRAWQDAVPADAETAQALIDAAVTMMEAMRDSRD